MLRRLIALAAAVAAAAGVWFAPAAQASTGPTLFASCATNDGNACAGYVAGGSGARFRFITATAFLRDPSAYSAITNGIGWQVGLRSPAGGSGWDAIIGVSDTTTTGTIYSPSVVVYHKGTLVASIGNGVAAEWCPAGQQCQPAELGGGFPVGDTVTQHVFYDRTAGVAEFDASDPAGNLLTAAYHVGTGINFVQARAEAGFGTYSPPAANTSFVRYTNTQVTLYNGSHHALASWFPVSPEDATSTGTGAGTLQAFPGPLGSSGSGSGFAVSFEHVTARR